MIDRRKMIAALAGIAVTVASPAKARSPRPTIGILNFAMDFDVRVRQFRQALGALGHLDGKTVNIILRSANGVLDELPALARELVDLKVDVIIAIGPAAWAAKRASNRVPVVIAFSGDPVGDTIVADLARPGGNMTGFSYMSSELAGKRIELLAEAFRASGRIGVLYSPKEPATRLELIKCHDAADALAVKLVPIAAAASAELDSALQAARDQKVDGVVTLTHGFAVLNGARIIELAARHRVPVLYGWREFAEAGGLMSYGPDIGALVRGAANYVDQIIKGAHPGDLPIQQPTKFEFVVNLKTAQALGLTIPPSILVRADEVIE